MRGPTRHRPESTVLTPRFITRSVCPALLAAVVSPLAPGGPVTEPWPVNGPDDTACIAAAPCSGWYAAGDTFEDSVEIRSVHADLRRVITRAEIAALLPWMDLNGGPNGPQALAFTASGRVLYILVTDATPATDGQPSDAVLRYDAPSDTLSVFARLDAFDRADSFPHPAMVHHKGRLYVGTATSGIKVYSAAANSTTGALIATVALPDGGPVRGLSVDRDTGTLYAASPAAAWRASLSAFPSLSFVQITPSLGAGEYRAVAWADHFGAPAQRGLYLLRADASGSHLDWLTAAQASGASPQTPTPYTSAAATWHDLAATADGRLLISADEDAVAISDDADTRLSYDAWLTDEFTQHVVFARGLISPDGEPPGWVIDADVPPGAARFHPATPDAAAWTILVLTAADELGLESGAQSRVRTVLTRYAGLASDGIRPLRSADGIYKHWIDPFTGGTKATWPDELATLSTMKIVSAAARAMTHWPDDAQIALAAGRIIFRTRNWDAYFQPSTDAMAFKGLAGGGPDTSSFSRPFHEGIIFAEQAGAYGGAVAQTERTRWFTRSLWPTGTFLTGHPITTAGPGQFDPAFLSLYPALLSRPFRADGAWRAQVRSVRWSSAAWTDDNGPRFFTVFSAGTSPQGYNADSLANHPADITTFTSLLALSAFGDDAESVGAYAAYRKGARQAFKTGAQLLYRRSDTTPAYTPNSAGLPDVALGGLGLAELLQPGLIDRVLAAPYPGAELCPVDANADGRIDVDDLYARVALPADLNGDGATNGADWACLRAWLRRNEAASMSR